MTTVRTQSVTAMRRAAFLRTLIVLIVVMLPQHYSSHEHTANESARIYAAQAIVYHGTSDLSPIFDRYVPGWQRAGRPPNIDLAKVDDAYVLDKAPGLSLLAVPVVAISRVFGVQPSVDSYPTLAWLLTLLLCALPTLAFLSLFTRWTRANVHGRWGRADTWTYGIPVALIIATPWLAYGGMLFGHALAASLLGIGMLLTLGNLYEPERPRILTPDGTPNVGQMLINRQALMGGLALGGAVLTEFPVAILVLLICAALLVDARKRFRLPSVILGGLAPALILLLWNYWLFDNPLSFSYGHKVDPGQIGIHAEGAYGITWPSVERLALILFGSQRGLFFLSPWLLLAVVGSVAVWRMNDISKAWKVVIGVGTLGFPVLISGFVDWQAGEAMGPRHLVASLPIFGAASVLGFGVIVQRRRDGLWRRAFEGFVFASFSLCLIGAYVFPYFSAQAKNPLFEVNFALLADGVAGRSILGTGAMAWFALILGLVLGALLLGATVRKHTRRGAQTAKAVALMSLVSFVYIIGGLAIPTFGHLSEAKVQEAKNTALMSLGEVERATKALERSCAKELAPSCQRAALFYRSGPESRLDYVRAMKLLLFGCRLADWQSCRDLGHMYRLGEGTPKNEQRALMFFDRARELRKHQRQ